MRGSTLTCDGRGDGGSGICPSRFTTSARSSRDDPNGSAKAENLIGVVNVDPEIVKDVGQGFSIVKGMTYIV